MLICMGLISAVLIAASPAHAGGVGVDVNIGFVLPFPGYVVSPPAVVVPAPVMVAPPPVVVYEQPVVIPPCPHGYYYHSLSPGPTKRYHGYHQDHW